MPRTSLFLKVEVEHGKEEDPERLGAEIARHILKIYGVQSAELSNYVTLSEE